MALVKSTRTTFSVSNFPVVRGSEIETHCWHRYLGELGVAGESGGEFLSLYKRLISSDQWKCYLALRGVLPTLGLYISREIDELTLLEDTTLSSDLSQGYALKALTGQCRVAQISVTSPLTRLTTSYLRQVS